MNAVSPGYFEAMKIPLLEGRDFTRMDEEPLDDDHPWRVCIVNKKFADHFFQGKSAVGRHVGQGVGPDTKLNIEIIGVVADALYEGPREGVHRQVFVPNHGNSSVTYYVRAQMASAAIYT